VEQQSGPPSTEGTRDETRPAGRFTRDPGADRPEINVDERLADAPVPEPGPEQPRADEAQNESSEEAAPIMSNLPHTRPQQRSHKRAAPKRPAKRQASASGRKAATGRGQATPRSRSRSQTAEGRRPSAPAPAKSEGRGIPAQALDAAVQVATAPWKLTFSVTRRAANSIGKRLGL
jgi:hypothetical protein